MTQWRDGTWRSWRLKITDELRWRWWQFRIVWRMLRG